jgi:hypothetical protein
MPKHVYADFITTSSSKLNFEITPQIQALMQRDINLPDRYFLLSSQSPNTEIDEDGRIIYDSSITLPGLDDQKAILAWIGINEEISETVMQDYREHLAGNVPLPYGSVLHPAGSPEETMLYHLVRVFNLGIARGWSSDEANTFGKHSHSWYKVMFVS